MTFSKFLGLFYFVPLCFKLILKDIHGFTEYTQWAITSECYKMRIDSNLTKRQYSLWFVLIKGALAYRAAAREKSAVQRESSSWVMKPWTNSNKPTHCHLFHYPSNSLPQPSEHRVYVSVAAHRSIELSAINSNQLQSYVCTTSTDGFKHWLMETAPLAKINSSLHTLVWS